MYVCMYVCMYGVVIYEIVWPSNFFRTCNRIQARVLFDIVSALWPKTASYESAVVTNTTKANTNTTKLSIQWKAYTSPGEVQRGYYLRANSDELFTSLLQANHLRRMTSFSDIDDRISKLIVY